MRRALSLLLVAIFLLIGLKCLTYIDTEGSRTERP